ncbi:hypothetical protein B0H11DRAFT_721835 [Mycena galericulata]|nr:hypothetical protein B0H11DRAFT_721835 [Mycena galericulata]
MDSRQGWMGGCGWLIRLLLSIVLRLGSRSWSAFDSLLICTAAEDSSHLRFHTDWHRNIWQRASEHITAHSVPSSRNAERPPHRGLELGHHARANRIISLDNA